MIHFYYAVDYKNAEYYYISSHSWSPITNRFELRFDCKGKWRKGPTYEGSDFEIDEYSAFSYRRHEEFKKLALKSLTRKLEGRAVLSDIRFKIVCNESLSDNSFNLVTMVKTSQGDKLFVNSTSTTSFSLTPG